MLSVIIPSYRDPYLHKTIDSILENSGLDEIEVIVVLDGYWPEVPIKNDPRIRIVHLGKNVGMREAINTGVSVARGDFIMRSDEHCLYDKDFAKKITEACQENEIMTASRYFLDPVKWEVMTLSPYVYEKLKITEDGRKFEGRRWSEREQLRKEFEVDETMSMQGSFWVMHKSWWEKVIKELDSKNYGPLIQDSHEMVFKTWQAGGRLMVHKGTFFAHKHVSFPRTHNQGTKENPADNERGYKYAIDTWKNYYYDVIVPRWKL